MKELIVYFSRAHENYVNGVIRNLNVGNTEVAANILQKLTGADLFRIEPVNAYAKDYNECIAQAHQDQQTDARPKLKGYPKNFETYDTIYLCYPNYWSTMPMPVFTFLEHFDFMGKRLIPLCTHEGSGMGGSEKDLRRLALGATLERGLALQGGRVEQAEPTIQEWLKELKREKGEKTYDYK